MNWPLLDNDNNRMSPVYSCYFEYIAIETRSMHVADTKRYGIDVRQKRSLK